MYDRELYRSKCKYLGTEDICLRDSGYVGGLWYTDPSTNKRTYSGIHMTISCDGNCRRMKRYDKLNTNDKERKKAVVPHRVRHQRGVPC